MAFSSKRMDFKGNPMEIMRFFQRKPEKNPKLRFIFPFTCPYVVRTARRVSESGNGQNTALTLLRCNVKSVHSHLLCFSHTFGAFK